MPTLTPTPTPLRRVLAIWCARLAIDRWRLVQGVTEGEGIDAAPLALITETAHGPRITAANTAGLAAGAQPGTMLADARTLCPQLAVAPADPAGDLAFLEKLAVWSQRWAPWSALDPPDGVIVDVTGAAHLFGGEAGLLADARAIFTRRRLSVRLAIAPTAGAAWALAHHGPADAVLPSADDPAQRLAHLPVAALRLDDDTLTLLKRLGLKRLGDLHGVHRDALVRRFRNRRSAAANPLIRMDQLLGRVPEPLLPVLATEAPLVQRRLMEPIRHRELLERVVADLCSDMARVLEGQALGARRLELGMWKVDNEVIVRRLEVSQSSRDPAHLADLLGRKLDGIDAGFGIEMVRLRASWTEPLTLAQRDFDASAENHGTSLAACIDRLTVRLGADAVRRPVPRASYIPERAQVWQGPLEPEKTAQGELEFHARPLKLLDQPERIEVIYETPDGLPRTFRWRGAAHMVARAEGPERIAPEWWRERSTTRLRDYYRIEDDEGCRYWVYRSGLVGDGRGGMPEWFLQGMWG
ncbi:DNA polymerase Y family protein [Novosphingobium sp. 9U]|uniref:Y-family DNA polymerase n=1 Tax=Novosphingobium sp. 9U TaxID=2653158 RepID=UPI0012F0E456|nr:DNA polymerase Y family protein [Novosphingobium sp. 9U]VWX51655.1 Protein ImuB [Novosphingobium sp. 9U]